MKSSQTSWMLCLVGLAGTASSSALADDSGWYVGANVGQSEAKIDDARITSGLLAGGLTTTSIAEDESDLGYKLFGGYQFTRYVALEAGYFDLGKFNFTATTVPLGSLSGSIKVKGLNVDAVGLLPIGDRFSAFGRVGVIYADANDSFSGSGSVNVLDSSPSERATNYKFGLGLQYDFTASLGMRAEAERYRIDDAIGNEGDIDLYSAGLVYRFGRSTPTPAPYVAAPVPVVALPPPQPVAAPPPPPRPLKVNFSADSLFDFDKSTLRSAGKQELDRFATDLQGTDFDVITITGHTDRIGSHDYNMALSTRRAEAVKTYLAESAGIPAGKISARGMDGSDPVTKSDECRGTKATKQLIACLQPDRRVEVEVSGTK